MDPIIIGCSFQRLSRIDRFVHLFLLLSIVVCYPLGGFAINTITLSVLLGFLFMGSLWGLNEVMLGVFNRAEHAFILLEGCQYGI